MKAIKEIRSSKKSRRNVPIRIDILHCQFQRSFREFVGDNNEYVIDDTNIDVIYQLYYWMTGNRNFEGDLDKGIMLVGKFGTGKTTMIKAIKYIIEKYSNKRIEFISAYSLMRLENLDHYFKRPLIIDDFAREETEVKEYGTIRRPLTEVFTFRYLNNTFNMATSNFKHETHCKKYGNYIGSRLTEMFNYIELKGENKRK